MHHDVHGPSDHHSAGGGIHSSAYASSEKGKVSPGGKMATPKKKEQRKKTDEIWVCQDCQVVLDTIDGRKPRCPVCRRDDSVVPVPKM